MANRTKTISHNGHTITVEVTYGTSTTSDNVVLHTVSDYIDAGDPYTRNDITEANMIPYINSRINLAKSYLDGVARFAKLDNRLRDAGFS